MEYNTKYSKEFKLDCVLKYLNGEYVETPPNTKRHTFTNKVGEWVRLYNLHGYMVKKDWKMVNDFSLQNKKNKWLKKYYLVIR